MSFLEPISLAQVASSVETEQREPIRDLAQATKNNTITWQTRTIALLKSLLNTKITSSYDERIPEDIRTSQHTHSSEEKSALAHSNLLSVPTQGGQ